MFASIMALQGCGYSMTDETVVENAAAGNAAAIDAPEDFPITLPFVPPLVFHNADGLCVWIDETVSTYRDVVATRRFVAGPLRDHLQAYGAFIHTLEESRPNFTNFDPRDSGEKIRVIRELLDVCRVAQSKGVLHARSPEAGFFTSLLQEFPLPDENTVAAMSGGLPLPLAFLDMLGQRAKSIHEAEQPVFSIEQRILNNDYVLKKTEAAAVALELQLHDAEVRLAESRDELSRFKETFQSSISLSEPVQNWETLSKNYSCYAWLYLVAVIVAMAGGMGAAVYLVANLSGEQIPWPSVGLIALGGTLLLWLIRLLVKFSLSNRHLSIDAKERATLTKSYLSLLDKGGLSPEEKLIFFSTIFRPCTSGMVKEEGMQTPYDILCGLSGKALDKMGSK